MNFEKNWNWWISDAPCAYLRHVDLYMFSRQPCGTRSHMKKAEVQKCWIRNKFKFENNFVRKHWLNIIILSVQDKLTREQQKLQERVSCNLTIFWKSSIFRIFGFDQMIFSENGTSEMKTIEIQTIGYSESFVVDEANIYNFAPLNTNYIVHFDSNFCTMFGIRSNWVVCYLNSVTGICSHKYSYAFPLVNYLMTEFKSEVFNLLQLPNIISSIVIDYLDFQVQMNEDWLSNKFPRYFLHTKKRKKKD